MNKKQIAALAMCVATAATAVVGGTLAYFTDKDKVNNVFAIGDLDINLYENVGMKDSTGNVVEALETKEETGHTYNDLVPTYEIIKQPVIENTGSYDAYVRVAVVMNNLSEINDAIDGVYEEADLTADDIQDKYDEIFNGWGINYDRREADARRMWMDARTDSHVLGNIDMIGKVTENYAMVDMANQFQTADEIAKFADAGKHDGILDTSLGDPKGYYWNAANADERVYVFYLKLAGKDGDTVDSYKLFDGLNVPADFTAEQMAMFDDLKIDVYADAIQVAGFADYTAAFNALEAEHPLGWWND